MLSVHVMAEWEISAWFHWQASRQHSALLETGVTHCRCDTCVSVCKCLIVIINLLQVTIEMFCQVQHPLFTFLLIFCNFFFFIISHFVYYQTQYIWKWICHCFFNASSLKSFQKAAHHLVFFWVISPISSLSHTNVAAIFSAAYLCNALQLHHNFLGNSVCCSGGYFLNESQIWAGRWELKLTGYVASRGSSQPISHLRNCMCRHLCLKHFYNRVKAPNDFQTLKRITKSALPVNCFATCC